MLLQNGAEIEERDYFKEPFTEAELASLAGEIGASQMFAKRSPSLKKMGLAGKEMADDEMLALMLQEPRLVRRPIIRLRGRFLVGANLKVVEAALTE